jgi:hypothetical protein
MEEREKELWFSSTRNESLGEEDTRWEGVG